MLTLDRITAYNFEAVVAVKAHPRQAQFCPDNAYSLIQSQFYPGTWRRAICVDGKPAGFTMLYVGKVKTDGELFLWRFMIGRQFQSCGHGSGAFQLVLARIRRAWPHVSTLRSCFVRGRGGPEKFWVRQGFEITGTDEASGEVPMIMRLRTP